MRSIKEIGLITILFVLFSACSKKDKSPVDKEGRLHGTVIEYYNDSAISKVSHYIHGQKSDTEITYFLSGQPEVIAIYSWDSFASVLNGDYFHYYDNGQLLLKGHYIEGLPDDTFRLWTPEGQLVSEEVYRKGITRGIWSYFDSIGHLYLQVEHDSLFRLYHETLKSGKYIWYDSSGRKVYEASWAQRIQLNDSIYQPEAYEEMLRAGIIDTSMYVYP